MLGVLAFLGFVNCWAKLNKENNLIQKYQKKPIEPVDAVQLTAENWQEVTEFVSTCNFDNDNVRFNLSIKQGTPHFVNGVFYLLIVTQNGAIAMFQDEWIVKTKNKNLFRFSNGEFKKLYSPTE